MNFMHMKCAIEVAKTGSINKASESLYIAPPNMSRSIKELERDLGISIFHRTSRGMELTPDGELFIRYAKNIINQIENVEKVFRHEDKVKQHFSVSVPRASYISAAFANFSKNINGDTAEIFYNETNASNAVNNILESDYRLGVVRYAEHHDKYFKSMFEKHGLEYKMIAKFNFILVMNTDSPLAKLKQIHFDDLYSYIEIAHADPFVPSIPLAMLKKEELPGSIGKRIFVFERGSQFELLNKNPQTFMWVSPLPDDTLARFNLIQRKCCDNRKIYYDVLIYKKDYSLSALDKKFIDELYKSKEKYFI